MATEQERINVISDAAESTEDRGPLIQDKELSEVKDMVEEATTNTPASADDVMDFLEADDDILENSQESYIDERVAIARDIRPMIAAWHEYKGAMSQVKANYKLWKVESELAGSDAGTDQRKENLIQSASRLKTSTDFIEKEIKESFPKLQGVAFLTRSELLVLPTWMHELLNIQIEATEAERLAAQQVLQEQMESDDSQE